VPVLSCVGASLPPPFWFFARSIALRRRETSCGVLHIQESPFRTLNGTIFVRGVIVPCRSEPVCVIFCHAHALTFLGLVEEQGREGGREEGTASKKKDKRLE